MSKPREIPGAQTAQRALQILKLLGTHHAAGLSAQEIVAATGAERSAVQRALGSLVEEGLASRGPSQRRYHLGVEAIHLGRATMAQSPLIATYKFALQKIARTTGDTVYLGVRMGDFVLCLHREEGSAPVRVARTRVGDLRPLGMTAGGLALLANMRDEDIQVLYERHEPTYQAARLDLTTLRQRVRHVRQEGYAVISDSVSEGVTGIGVGLGRGEPFATVSIGAMTRRMGPERLHALYQLLREVEVDPSGPAG